MAEIKVVNLTNEDYERVLDINRNIYFGNDYIPTEYHHFFHRGGFRVYALEQNDILVSFVIFMVGDGGHDVTSTSVRVRATHQGQGLSVEKNRALRDRLKSDVPNVRRELYATTMTEGTTKKINHSTVLYRWNVICRRLRVNDQRLDMLNEHHAAVGRLSYSTALKLLETGNKLQDFFLKYSKEYIPADVNWIPVKIDKGELRRHFAFNNTLVTLTNPTNNSTVNDDIMHGDIKALSYCSSCPVRNGCRSDIYYYGGMDDAAHHVIEHIRHLANISDDILCLWIHLPDATIPLEDFDKLLEACQLKNADIQQLDGSRSLLCYRDF